jgi:glycosyltransferase involved in cell wall biosynthesis
VSILFCLQVIYNYTYYLQKELINLGDNLFDILPRQVSPTVLEFVHMRTAIVHYWLLNMRGGERVVEALCKLFPDADIFTLFYDPEKVSPLIRSRRVTASFLNPLRRVYRSLLPLMPMALESLDLRGYDLVISSESGPAKGVITSSSTLHVCYCHTPMRYLWELYPAYLHEWTKSSIQRVVMAPLANYLRLWDFASAARVDGFIANSEAVRKRIWKTYRREASVIHPPVAVSDFYWKPPEDYFLIVTELVAYKQVDYAVKLFSRTGRNLKIVGDGPEYQNLKRGAVSNVEFCGRVGYDNLRELFARCSAFLVPGEEDFGIAAVEALASGKPIIALGRGGSLEIVPPIPGSGVFYREPSEQALQDAISQLESLPAPADHLALQSAASRFSPEQFAKEFQHYLTQLSADSTSAPASSSAHQQ